MAGRRDGTSAAVQLRKPSRIFGPKSPRSPRKPKMSPSSPHLIVPHSKYLAELPATATIDSSQNQSIVAVMTENPAPRL